MDISRVLQHTQTAANMSVCLADRQLLLDRAAFPQTVPGRAGSPQAWKQNLWALVKQVFVTGRIRSLSLNQHNKCVSLCAVHWSVLNSIFLKQFYNK